MGGVAVVFLLVALLRGGVRTWIFFGGVRTRRWAVLVGVLFINRGLCCSGDLPRWCAVVRVFLRLFCGLRGRDVGRGRRRGVVDGCGGLGCGWEGARGRRGPGGGKGRGFLFTYLFL